MQLKFMTTFLATIICCFTLAAQVNENNILGLWTSPKKDTRVLIYKENNLYAGKIVWGAGTQTKDVKNPNTALRNRDLIGLVILNHFTYDGNGVFINGTIYDPRNGQSYTCKMTLKNGNELLIRGYVGIPLFGRTEIWAK